MHVAIIGNGITGVTAALRLREREPEWRITLVSGESNHHYSRPALMYVFMGHMRYQDTKPYEDRVWKERRIDLVRDWVTRIDTDAKELVLHRGTSLGYDKLLLALGSKSNKFGWPGQDLKGVQGLYSLMDLKKLHDNCVGARHAVIVGGGLIGIELAEMLHSRGLHVTFLVREKGYWSNILPPEESAMVGRLIQRQGMDLRLETELVEIVDDGNGRACAVVTKAGERIDCQIVGLTAGVSPNVGLAAASGIPIGRGILVDDQLRTKVPDVFAAGDCAEIETPEGERNVIQQVWYTGKMQAAACADVMVGDERSYDPGIWYNSAKFLDLEYQTYGEVFQGREGEAHLVWELGDPPTLVRVVYRDADRRFIGVNLMGTRSRHRVWERWIREGRSVEHVLAHLEEAGFDPELFTRHEREIRAALEAQLRSGASEEQIA